LEETKRGRGRPGVPEYRKKTYRFSAIEDKLKQKIKQMESNKDKQLLEEFLAEMRG